MNTCIDLHEVSMKRPISLPFGGSAEVASAAAEIGCTGALREQFQAAQHPSSGLRVKYVACSTSAALRTTFRTRRKPDAPPLTIPGICCMYAAQQLDRTPQRNQIKACVSRPAAAKISAWRTFRGRTQADAKATSDAVSPEHRSRCQMRATNLSPIRLLLPPAAAAELWPETRRWRQRRLCRCRRRQSGRARWRGVVLTLGSVYGPGARRRRRPSCSRRGGAGWREMSALAEPRRRPR